MEFDYFYYLELCDSLLNAVDALDAKAIKDIYNKICDYIKSSNLPAEEKVSMELSTNLLACDRLIDNMENKGREKREFEEELNRILHPTL